MKEDKLFVVLFVCLIAILLLGLMPRYSIETAITGSAISLPSNSELWVGTAIVVITVIVAAATIFFKSRGSKFGKLVSESPMEKPSLTVAKPKTDEDKIQNYVQLSLSQGKSKSQIRHTLMAVGWPTDTIEKVIKNL